MANGSWMKERGNRKEENERDGVCIGGEGVGGRSRLVA